MLPTMKIWKLNRLSNFLYFPIQKELIFYQLFFYDNPLRLCSFSAYGCLMSALCSSVLCLCKLALVKLRVKSLTFEQGLVAALFDNIAVFHDEDDIRLPYCRKSVRNNETGSPFHHGRKCFLNPDFRSRINGRRRFVQNQHRRQAKHDSRNT